MSCFSAAGRTRSTAVGHDVGEHGCGSLDEAFAFDTAEHEQIVDDAIDPKALVAHASGQPLHDGRVVFVEQGVGQHDERTDRRLQLMADVGHEVAPDGVDALLFGDVVDDGDGAEDAPSPRWSGMRMHHERAFRRPESSDSRSARSSAYGSG